MKKLSLFLLSGLLFSDIALASDNSADGGTTSLPRLSYERQPYDLSLLSSGTFSEDSVGRDNELWKSPWENLFSDKCMDSRLTKSPEDLMGYTSLEDMDWNLLVSEDDFPRERELDLVEEAELDFLSERYQVLFEPTKRENVEEVIKRLKNAGNCNLVSHNLEADKKVNFKRERSQEEDDEQEDSNFAFSSDLLEAKAEKKIKLLSQVEAAEILRNLKQKK